ncbi:uncharacterized protein LOC143371188 [Andrena cerasifolii]|uniref:uncharacterized protein LOC143371188 n=1 Tax=Andrena cerasifolii TaxID=2819439 RepID=UPI0040377A6C
MHCESYNCYKFDHIFLPLIRLWIDNASWLRNLQDFIYLLILLSALVIQISPLITTSIGLDNVLNDVSYITVTCISLLKYGEFRYPAGKIRKLLENVQNDWSTIQNDEEYKIMRKYVQNGQYIGLVLASKIKMQYLVQRIYSNICFIPGLVFVLLSPLYPTVLNIITPTNETRTFRFPVDIEYFVDQRKYFTFIILHLELVCTLEMLILFITEVVCVTFIEHSCALFKIAGYLSLVNADSAELTVAAFLHTRDYTQNSLVNVVTNLTFTVSIYLAAFSILVCQQRTSHPNDKSGFSDDQQINMYFFTDNQEYFYIKLLFLYAFIIMGAIATTGAEVTVLLMAHHSSGLFHVVCYRTKRALNAEFPKASVFEKNKTVSESLVDAAKMHKRTLKYCKCLESTFGASYFILLSLGVVSLSLNLVRLSQAKVQGRDFKEMMVEMFVILVHFVYLFLANYMGQLIMDSSSIIFREAYNTEWYAVPVPAQKLYLYVMQHSMKNYTFQLGGFFVPSYEGFCTLSRLSFSYVMVILSTRS